MAKPQSAKQATKTGEASEASAPVPAPAPEALPNESVTPPVPNSPLAAAAKKELPRSKNQVPPKGGSWLPSAYKLEQLKAAVAAAGGTEKLLLIMHHVEEAGGKAEVTESIEAYRVLKTVLEE